MKIWLSVICLFLIFGLVTSGQDDMDAVPGDEPGRFVTGRADAAGIAEPVADERLTSRSKRQLHVEVDEGTRTMIITTDPTTNLQVRDIIRALDKPVPQALIKVLFLEVTHNDDMDIGVDARYTGNRSIISSIFGVGAETQGGIVSILQTDLEVTMRALAEVGRLNVLSRPSILTRNNQEATITIGQEVPFIRNSRITQDGQIINTVEYEDIGIILTVTPRIGVDGLIELDVAPEISTLTGQTVPISGTVNAPVFAKRSAQTHVIVPSGKTVVIGGLMEDQETVNVRKVPILGDIPGLGVLFRRKITTKQKTELLIFLTPTIVTDGAHLVRMSDDESSRATLMRQQDEKRLDFYMDREPSAAADLAPSGTP